MLVDSPPLLPVTDAVVLSKQVDATLLVVAPGQTRRVTLRRSSEKLAQVNAPVVGLVLNGVNKQSGYGYGYGYGYVLAGTRASRRKWRGCEWQGSGCIGRQ